MHVEQETEPKNACRMAIFGKLKDISRNKNQKKNIHQCTKFVAVTKANIKNSPTTQYYGKNDTRYQTRYYKINGMDLTKYNGHYIKSKVALNGTICKNENP